MIVSMSFFQVDIFLCIIVLIAVGSAGTIRDVLRSIRLQNAGLLSLGDVKGLL